ncbi:hypothetical protein [Streptomyces thermolilacinus]|uniref:Uncharacterized protein n=1 Tax=Streptomyces thermolilacinus SPC6 TaxID=1306406 RepID=A0A1D3E0V8_9ACTN|nr:hypothetical protein [Streptomyces thermolilacinus]OEJ98212.1 hypothetical protein J116_019350 [Streptomyces thermolilacinus SPC6]
MELRNRPSGCEPEGCLVAAIRLPVRIVALVVVVPVRMAWDVLALCARTLHRTVLRPLGRVLLVIPLTWLWRAVLTPLGRGVAWLVRYAVVVPAVWAWTYLVVAPAVWAWRYLVVVPAVWLWRNVLVPAGAGIAWLVRYLVVVPAGWLWRWVLVPVGQGVAWLLRVLVAVPLGALWRWVLVPLGRALAFLGRELVAALAVAWRVAGYVSRAVGRALKWTLWQTVGRPARWFYRSVCTPIGHFVRDAVWRPVRDAVRDALSTARRTLRRALS